MKVHHLNCATLCPAIGDHMVCHCLLIETNDGLVLVDTGFGTGDVEHPEAHHALFRGIARPRFSMEETAIAQVRALGFSPSDVRHILPTHLDLDHSGGLGDFPDATVHIFEPEHRAAMNPTAREKMRYIPRHWAHGPNWQTYSVDGEPWFGFETVRGLRGLPPEILFVPLVGHTRGHSGIAVDTSAGWQLHAGDAYFFHGEMDEAPHCPASLRAFQSLVQIDGKKRKQNQARLRALANGHKDSVKVFSAHDPIELARFGTVAGDAPD